MKKIDIIQKKIYSYSNKFIKQIFFLKKRIHSIQIKMKSTPSETTTNIAREKKKLTHMEQQMKMKERKLWCTTTPQGLKKSLKEKILYISKIR